MPPNRSRCAAVADLVGRDPARLTLAGDWLGRDFVLPLPGGEGRAKLSDANNCFNLNSLVAETMPGRFSQRAGSMRQFGELMTLLGIDAAQAQAIAGATADWIDSDSNDGPLGAEDNVYRSLPGAYLAANRKMADVSELRAVRGVSPKIFARLKPWICVLPVTDPVRLNVNTLAPEQAPLVAMLLPGEMTLADARAALAARPAGGYGSSVRFWEAPPARTLRPADRRGRTGGRDQPLADADDECDDGGRVFDGSFAHRRQRRRAVRRTGGPGDRPTQLGRRRLR